MEEAIIPQIKLSLLEPIVATGSILLAPEDIEEFYNEVHDTSTGRFGEASGGTVREKEARGQSETKGEIKGQATRGKTKKKGRVSNTVNNLSFIQKVEIAVAVGYVGTALYFQARSSLANRAINRRITKEIMDNPYWPHKGPTEDPRTPMRNAALKNIDLNNNSFTGIKASKWANLGGTGTKGVGKGSRKFSKIVDGAIDGEDGWIKHDDLIVKRAYGIQAVDGKTIKLYDLDGTMHDNEIEELLSSASYMHEMYPMKKPVKLVVANNEILRARSETTDVVGAHGWVNISEDPHIFVNASMKDVNPADDNWFMPAGKKTKPMSYVVMHEYGHKYDYLTGGHAGGGKFGIFHSNRVQSSMSPYGMSHYGEGYAEAFAEWHVTQGKTSNSAAIAYANHEGWFGSSVNIIERPATRAALRTRVAKAVGEVGERIVRTPEGARRYGVSIGQPIPEAKELLNR